MLQTGTKTHTAVERTRRHEFGLPLTCASPLVTVDPALALISSMTVRAAEFNSESLPAPYSEEEAAAYVRSCGWQ